jgi:hypothetical protein
MQRAWEYRPDRSWYTFVDDDTFVDRVNTLDWLGHYNPMTNWFFKIFGCSSLSLPPLCL